MGVIQSSIDRGISLISGFKKLSEEKKELAARHEADIQAKNEALKIQAYKKLHPTEAEEIENQLASDVLNDVIDSQSYDDARIKMYTQRQKAQESLQLARENDSLNEVDVVNHFKKIRRKLGGKVYGKK